MAANKRVTLLRLKRKRTEDPFQALLVRAKKSKDSPSRFEDEDCVFKLVKTSFKDTDVDATKLIDEVQSIPAEKILESKKKTYESYKITSKSDVLNHQGFNTEEEKEKEELLMEIYDVSKENLIQENDEDLICGSSDGNSSNTLEILCNSMKMFREKLTISEDSEIQDSEYVYDLYYGQEKVLGDTESLLYIQSLDQDLLCDIELDEQNSPAIDDEDDSNGENNWRNDYPEEDDFFSSDEEKFSQKDDDSETDSSSEDELEHSSFQGRAPFQSNWNDYENQYVFEAYDPLLSGEDD
ncbi:probable RNA polymerase II nuclear localization protein SLC7A6OS isoform X2 [Rhopilema esculentum]|uniref:probable RNA polymerase II nuclear localization protein SLC7A6OS isoform X2 n=1 Tax=Rhopilema esculentum TaxID=499914 RepID=UPI0031D2BDC8